MNTPTPQADLEGYRENLRQCLADLIERMDLHAIALAKLVSGAAVEDQDNEPDSIVEPPLSTSARS